MLLVGCAHSAGALTLDVGGTPVTAELADTPDLRAHGLMGRSALDPDAGMLFVYPDEAPRFYWMKDTPLPLAIAFLDASGHVVHLAEMSPFDTNTTPSEHPAQYALEMASGWFTAHHVQVGAQVGGLPPAAAR